MSEDRCVLLAVAIEIASLEIAGVYLIGKVLGYVVFDHGVSFPAQILGIAPEDEVCL